MEYRPWLFREPQNKTLVPEIMNSRNDNELGPRDVWNISQGMFLEFIINVNGVLFRGSLKIQGLYSMYLSQLQNICHSEDVNIKGEKRKPGMKRQKVIDLVDMVIGQYSSEIIPQCSEFW